MPSPAARLAGDSTTLASGRWRHMAARTSRPNRVSAVPYAAGLTGGSFTTTPRSSRPGPGLGGRGGDADPQPAASSAIAAIAAATVVRSCLAMPSETQRPSGRLHPAEGGAGRVFGAGPAALIGQTLPRWVSLGLTT